jgi:predicted permease
MTLQELIVGDRRPALLALAAAVGLVLLVACANVTNLLLARSLSRAKEMAVRTALGAGRGRVLQQLLVESLVLAGAGGLLGFVAARWGLKALAAMISDQVPRATEISVDARVLLFTIAASVVAGVLAGLVPAWRAGRTDVNSSLKDGGRSEPGVAAFRTRRLLIVAEVALSLVLLAGAAAMVRSLLALRHVDLGFNPTGVLTLDLALPKTPYDSDERRTAFFAAALSNVRALPGVASASYTDTLPISGGGSVQPVALDGQVGRRTDELPTVGVRFVVPEFMRTMQIPILKGRDVEPLDTETVLVSDSMAKLIWPGRDPIGQRVGFPLMSKTLTVVGIVGDARQDDIKDQPSATAYCYTKTLPLSALSLVVRTEGSPDALIKPVTSAITALDPNIPLRNTQTLRHLVDTVLSPEQFDAWVFGGFAVLALVLTSLGIFSVLSYLVRGRQREIGIRTALGAGVGDVVRLVVGEGLKPTIVGIVVGVAIAFAGGRVLERVVFGVSANDPMTLAMVALVLALVAVGASLVPAWRASRVEPLRVLR